LLQEGCPEPDPNRLTPFLTPTGTDLCWTHRGMATGRPAFPRNRACSKVTATPGPWWRGWRSWTAGWTPPPKPVPGERSPRVSWRRPGAAIQAEQADVRRRLGWLTALATMEPDHGRPGQLRTSWPQLILDQWRAVLTAVLERVVVHPALQPGRPTFDPRRVEVCWRETDRAQRRAGMQLAG